MHVLKAISLKIISALLFAVMSALVRFLGEKYPVGRSYSFARPLPFPGSADLCLEERACCGRAHGSTGRTYRPWCHEHFEHVLQFLRSRPVADRRCDRDLVCGAADDSRVGGNLAQGAGADLSMVGRRSGLPWHSGDADALFRPCAACDWGPAGCLPWRSSGPGPSAASVIQTRGLTETETLPLPSSSISRSFARQQGSPPGPSVGSLPPGPSSWPSPRSAYAAGSLIFF